MLSVFELQKKLLSVVAPSGFEAARSEIIEELAKPYVDEISRDGIGNLIAHKKGTGKKILLSAHMDTLGVIVKKITDKGYLKIEQLGNSFPPYLVCTPVKFYNGVKGNICTSSKITDLKDFGSVKNKDLYIDIGAKDADEANSMISVGDYAAVDLEPRMLLNNNMTSPYCDDITGCIALLIAMQNAKDSKNDIYYVFSTQEELRLGGATVASHHIKADIGIAVDVALAGDAPEACEDNDVVLGKGPIIEIKDNSIVCTPHIVKKLRSVAEKENINYQHVVMGIGGCDGSVIQRSRAGVPTGVLGIPMRCLHLPCETANVTDVENAGKLIAAFVGEEL